MARVFEFRTHVDMHLDADTLAAFVEQMLPKREKMAVFAHLADCEQCRERLRVQAQLRKGDETPLPAAARPSAWFFRTAAGLVCAVLSGAMLLWWSHGSQQPVPFSTTNANPPAEKSPPFGRAPLSSDGVSSLRVAPSELFGLTTEPKVHAQTSSHKIERLRWPQKTRSADRPSSLKVDLSHREEPTVWRSVRFPKVASYWSFHSGSAVARLPGPFVTARLQQQMYFGTVSHNESEEMQGQRGYAIAIRTALGERRFYWNGFANQVVINQ